MKMSLNWQAIINFILFAMIVVAFTFAIWSYVKTNAIKNSNSPSVPTVINDNNTYVNNIASAPNAVLYSLTDDNDYTYNLKSTDNGTTYYVSNTSGSSGKLILNIQSSLPDGFYINVNNIGTNTFHLQAISNGYQDNSNNYDLAPGQYAILGKQISDIINGNFANPGIDGFPVISNGTPA
jgi:hypothetical protein